MSYTTKYINPRRCRVFYLKRIRKVNNRINPIQKRENPSTTKANRPVTEKLVAGNIDYRIPGIPHSTVQQHDTNRKETVKKFDSAVRESPKQEFFLAGLEEDCRNSQVQRKVEEVDHRTWAIRRSSSFANPLPRSNAQIGFILGNWH